MPRPQGIHPRVLRELADVTMRLLSMILEVLQQLGKVPEDWEKANVAPVFGKGQKGDRRQHRLVGLALVLWKRMEQNMLGTGETKGCCLLWV